MRKKIFIIHGKGVNKGIGRESGGDLDTISSNAFYAVWAQNYLKKELGREVIFGVDYDFDFINYSEGINHLAARKGCDVYIPDFPIDALAPRLKLIHISDEESVVLLNSFTLKMDEYKMWIIEHAPSMDEEFKEMFNLMYKQIPKVIGHQEIPVLFTANSLIDLCRGVSELHLFKETHSESKVIPALKHCVENLMNSICREPFYAAKEKILDLMDTELKYEMSEAVSEKDLILAFDRANSQDMSTRGRIGYTDELIILGCETVAYLVRTRKQLDTLPFEEGIRNGLEERIVQIVTELSAYYNGLLTGMLALGTEETEVNSIAEKIRKALNDCISVVNSTHEPVRRKESRGDENISVMLIEDATGRAVEGIEIVFDRLRGGGDVLDRNGNSLGNRNRYIVETDPCGSARIVYRPVSEGEPFQFNATFNELSGILIPKDVKVPDQATDALAEPVAADEDLPEAGGSNRAEKVSLLLIDRMFRFLRTCDVRIISLDDHHPYSPDILSLLESLKSEGLIENIQVHAAPRGEEEPKEKQCCGADLIYKDRVKGQPWDNDGLAYLCHLAHMQDLHIELIPLSIELSKLIGSGYNKIDMVMGLSRVMNKDMMLNIMAENCWDEEVRKYDEGLEKVLPRTETNLAHISFIKKPENGDYAKNLLFTDWLKKCFFAPKAPEKRACYLKRLYYNNPANRMQVMAALSPFTDAKKGETKINVASAIGYLLGKRKHYADYFFYCYGSNIMTTRQPNEKENSINLSTLAQHVGTPADGGHKGAATCQPASNPNYPKKELGDVKEKNILEFFHYLGKKISEYNSSLEFYEVRPVRIDEYTKPVEKTLGLLKYNLIEYEFTCPGSTDRIKAILTKAPKADPDKGGAKPAITQVIERIARDHEPDYIFFCQGGMYSIILYNLNDKLERLDLREIGRKIGWEEDSGNIRLTVCSPKRNRSIPKSFRWLRDDDFYEFSVLLKTFINQADCSWKAGPPRPMPLKEFPKEILDTLYKIEAGIYVLTLRKKKGVDSAGPKKLKVICSLAPFIGKGSDEIELSTTFMVSLISELKPDYFLYLKYRKLLLMSMKADASGISCGRVLNGITGNQAVVSEKDHLASIDPSLIEEFPEEFAKINARNVMDFIRYFVGKIGEHTDYELSDLVKRPSRH